MKSTVYSSTRQFTQVTTGSCPMVQAVCPMQLCLHNTLFNYTPLVRLITTFACITLPEFCADFCMGVQHSYPNLLLFTIKLVKFSYTCSIQAVYELETLRNEL